MNPRERDQRRLGTLLRERSLPASQCGRALREWLAPLLAGGILAWERSGAGRRLAVADPAALEVFYHEQFPEVEIPPGAPGRLAGVGRFRDSKAFAGAGAEIVALKAWREEALWRDGRTAGAAAATAAHGVFAFLLREGGGHVAGGGWMLIENPAVFVHAERLRAGADAALYGHGRISGRLLDWLARPARPDFQLLHLPDYDPAGLSEFARLRARLGNRVSLFLPPDLETRFQQFANPGLLKKPNTQAMLARLRRAETPGLRRVVELIDRHNAGLEQEALLL